jgi:signal-transduction protein with cAMP-binding, CBS, and nucleotidyltransferase domain
VTCGPKTAVAAVARIMRETNASAVVIMDPDNRIMGIVTDRDLTLRVLARELDVDTPVETVMTHGVVSVEDDVDAALAAQQMALQVCRHLPVVTRDGRLTGVVGLDDLILQMAASLELVGRVLQHEIHDPLPANANTLVDLR